MIKLNTDPDRWVLTFHQAQVQMIQVDFRLSLLLAGASDHAWVRFATDCAMKGGTTDVVLVPEQTESVAPVLSLFGASVDAIIIEKTGRITVRVNGIVLVAAPDDAYEAWELSCSIGESNCLFVCSPGGNVILFDESKDTERRRS